MAPQVTIAEPLAAPAGEWRQPTGAAAAPAAPAVAVAALALASAAAPAVAVAGTAAGSLLAGDAAAAQHAALAACRRSVEAAAADVSFPQRSGAAAADPPHWRMLAG